MKKMLFTATVTIGLLFTGCTYKTTPSAVTMDVSKVDFSKIESMKKGRSCINKFLFFMPSADISIREIAKEAGINNILYVEDDQTHGLFTNSYCTTVYGK